MEIKTKTLLVSNCFRCALPPPDNNLFQAFRSRFFCSLSRRSSIFFLSFPTISTPGNRVEELQKPDVLSGYLKSLMGKTARFILIGDDLDS